MGYELTECQTIRLFFPPASVHSTTFGKVVSHLFLFDQSLFGLSVCEICRKHCNTNY